MASVNKVILMGHLGRDPELRYSPSGAAVCNLSLATTRTWKDKAGERQEETEWHRVVLYERLAEIAGEYLKKGRPVYIEGRIKHGKYTDKEGIERYTTDIVASELQLMGGRDDGDEGQRGGEGRSERPSGSRQAPANRESSRPASGAPHGDFEDDIPF